MEVTIDPASGFCFGVERAIGLAESTLDNDGSLMSLGELVHNGEENARLKSLGLEIIGPREIKDIPVKKVLVRAHGEPPATFETAAAQGIEILDGTCPIVKKLQGRVAQAKLEMEKKKGVVVIFGKKDHPEVIGLLGYAGAGAMVVRESSDLDGISFEGPVRLFAQTTMDPGEYALIKERIRESCKGGRHQEDADVKAYNTICGQVSGRAPKIASFARSCDVLIFVSGKNSSNGKVLYQAGLSANARSHWISSPEELRAEWFRGAGRVGISGATSTPAWLLKKVAQIIREI